jgi:hypothetical protein
MAMIVGVGLFLTLFADAASGASTTGSARSAKPFSYSKPSRLQCLPKIFAKCPRGEKRVCVEKDGRCCSKFACRKRER